MDGIGGKEAGRGGGTGIEAARGMEVRDGRFVWAWRARIKDGGSDETTHDKIQYNGDVLYVQVSILYMIQVGEAGSVRSSAGTYTACTEVMMEPFLVVAICSCQSQVPRQLTIGERTERGWKKKVVGGIGCERGGRRVFRS